jgi:N-acetylmuramoyl-L-alanine amidase
MQASHHPEKMRPSLCQTGIWLLSAGLVLSSIQSATANPKLPPLSVTPELPPTKIVDLKPVLAEPVQQPVVIPVPLPVVDSTNNKKERPPERSALVMIDPGHGGKDSGAVGVNGLREVDVILPIALQVAEILKKNGVATQLTRDRDYFVGLNERVQMSSQAGASIFVSIHANSIDNRPDVNGLETYYYNAGEELANTVHQKIINFFNVDIKVPLNDRRVRSARFLVLRKSAIPAILVETGYLSSPEEVLKLGKADYQSQMAKAIAQGILEYLGKGAKSSPTVTLPRS